MTLFGVNLIVRDSLRVIVVSRCHVIVDPMVVDDCRIIARCPSTVGHDSDDGSRMLSRMRP